MIERLLAGQEQMKEMMERQIGPMVSRIAADMKTDRDESQSRGNDDHVKCPSWKDDILSLKSGGHRFEDHGWGNGIQNGTLGGPKERCHSETGWRMEELAEGLKSGCRALPGGEGQIPKEIGCCPQRDNPPPLPCKSGMVKGKRQEEPDQG